MDPDSWNQVPDTDPDPVPDPGFWDQKLKKTKAEKKIIFLSKIAIYLSLGLLKGRPNYKKSLHSSAFKREHQAL